MRVVIVVVSFIRERLDPRIVAGVLSLAMIAVTLSPVLRKPADDGYPLSTYPMFAFRRPTKLTMDYAIGVTPTGERRHLRPRHVGSQEVLQARAILARAVAGGPKAQAALCGVIAGRIAADPVFADVVTLQLVTGSHDAVDYLVRKQVGRETVRATCRVAR